MRHAKRALPLLAVFLVGFGVVEIGYFGSVALAISVSQLLLVGFLTVSSSRFMYESRAGLRREVIHSDGMREIGRALEAQDYELAVGALMEWNRTFLHEVAMQEAHPWSPVRFWKFPPGYREDWK